MVILLALSIDNCWLERIFRLNRVISTSSDLNIMEALPH
jgi:hypothetical protein